MICHQNQFWELKKVLSIIIPGQYMWTGNLLAFGLSRHKAHAKLIAWGTILSFWVKTWKRPDLVLKKKNILDMPIQWRKAPCGTDFLPIFLRNHRDPKSIIANKVWLEQTLLSKPQRFNPFKSFRGFVSDLGKIWKL